MLNLQPLKPTSLAVAILTLALASFTPGFSSTLAGQVDTSANTADQALDEAAFNADQLEFFEKNIRPLLVNHCYECHSEAAGEAQGGLWVDSREALQNGGDSGPAIEPGDAAASLLLEALRYESYEMPPEGMLPDDKIELVAQWIDMGAPDPRSSGNSSSRPAIDFSSAREHWSYQPIHSPHLEGSGDAHQSQQPIDSFIRSRLAQHGLQPADPADRATLVRRLYYDLTGLPPSPAQLEVFINDNRSDAYENLVDQLLASPRFGEHWGRHWLDVVRYADSLTLRGFVFPEAWRYRDYVIDSFNQDRPVDQFFRQQLAGDLLPSESTAEAQANQIATTFLTLGNTNLEQQDKRQLELDVVDEQLDVIGKGLLAQTITCARCHDHKFDPIPTKDYYALAGILANVQVLEHANVSKWIEQPLPLDGEKAKYFSELKKERDRLVESRKELQQELDQLKRQVPALDGIVLDQSEGEAFGTWQASTHTSPFIGDDYLHDQNAGKGKKRFQFSVPIDEAGIYEVRLSYTPGGSRATNVPVHIKSNQVDKVVRVDQSKSPPIHNQLAKLGEFQLEASSTLEVTISNEGTNGHVIVDALQVLPLNSGSSKSESVAQANAERRAAIEALQTKVDSLSQSIKEKEALLSDRPKAMTIVEKDQAVDLPVHIRGSVHSLGEMVPRGTLQVIELDNTFEFSRKSSGRLELANWITSESHPLTARVYANRVWYWLLGKGIVSTVDNFGTTGAKPTHPELLDYLATRLIQSNWSTKELIREIVLSKTYQQSGEVNDLAQQLDPKNDWLAYAPRKRLPAEAIRDAMLVAADRLDLQLGGRTFPGSLEQDYGFQDTSTRRSVYVPVFRNALPELFKVFDFPNPSLVSGKRNSSTTAPQALWMLNHPFAMSQASGTAERLLRFTGETNSQRIERAYLVCLGRSPNENESAIAREFLTSEQSLGTSEADAWSRFIQALFASVEFRYID